MTGDTPAYEEVSVLPFEPPSKELFELLAWYEHAVYERPAFEFQHEELKAFGELTPLQVDRLLTRGRL